MESLGFSPETAIPKLREAVHHHSRLHALAPNQDEPPKLWQAAEAYLDWLDSLPMTKEPHVEA